MSPYTMTVLDKWTHETRSIRTVLAESFEDAQRQVERHGHVTFSCAATTPFPDLRDCGVREAVYVFLADGVPFYVGQTGRLVRERLREYVTASYTACTDFRVGKVAGIVSMWGLEVTVAYADTDDRIAAERRTIQNSWFEGFHLLNWCPAYDYKKSNDQEQGQVCFEYATAIVDRIRPESPSDEA